MLQTAAERQRALTGGAISARRRHVVCRPCSGLVAFCRRRRGHRRHSFRSLYSACLRFTLLQALLSTALSIVFAIPVARALARQPHFLGRIWIIRLMAVPMGLPVLIGALGIDRDMGQAGVVELAYDEDRA